MQTEGNSRDSLKARASRAAGWSVVEIGSRHAVQIITTIILARLLVPEDFGLIAMLLIFTGVGQILANFGFGAALVQRRDITADDETTVFTLSAGLGLLLAFLLVLAAPWIASFYKQPELLELTYLMAGVLPVAGFLAVPEALLTRRLQFEFRAKSQLIASFAAGVLAVSLASMGWGAWSIAWQSLTAILLRCVAIWFFAGWIPKGRPSMQSFRRLFSFGGYILLARLIDTVYTRLQAVLVGRYFGPASAGIYSLAQGIQQAPTTLMGNVLSKVGLPVFSEVAANQIRLRYALRRSLRVAMFCFMPMMLGIALCAEPLIRWVYGEQWLAAAPVLSLLAMANAIWPLHALNLATLNACGRSDLFFRLSLIKKSIAISLVVLAASKGPIAVAVAVLASSVVSAGINTWYTKKLADYGLWSQLRDQKSTILLCAISAAPAWAILHWNPPSASATFSAIAVAFLIYGTGAHIVTTSPLREFIVLLKIIFQRRRSL